MISSLWNLSTWHANHMKECQALCMMCTEDTYLGKSKMNWIEMTIRNYFVTFRKLENVCTVQWHLRGNFSDHISNCQNLKNRLSCLNENCKHKLLLSYASMLLFQMKTTRGQCTYLKLVSWRTHHLIFHRIEWHF